MRTRTICIAAMIATTGLIAQDTKKKAQDLEKKAPAEGGMPSPKTEHHAALKRWAATWKVTGKIDAIPGVPGMEKPTESKGNETASLICDGLWLKWESDMECGGKRSTGVWLVGYDPFQKQYVSYWVSSEGEHCPGLQTMTGDYDKKTDTWTWVCETPQGKMRSVCKFSGRDSFSETCYAIGPDGKENKVMEMKRVRSKEAKEPVVNASLKEKPMVPASKHHAALLQDVGTWDATVETTCAGETTKEKGSERVRAICDGRWIWSEFRSQYQGKPFVGHALVGYDTKKKKYVNLWIDSLSATASVTTGTFDEKKKTYSFTGSCTGPDGKAMKIEQILFCEDKDNRVLRMKFDGPEMKSTMKITYARRAEK